MADRLTKIYTRSGDKGTTALANGQRLTKTAPRIEALGDIDELNSQLGVLIATLDSDDELLSFLPRLQHSLFDLGGELAVADPDYRVIDEACVQQLENQLDSLNTQLPPLKEFILPGGSPAAAQCHLARSICRRAERRLVALAEAEGDNVNPFGTAYVNRLSDLLFVCARLLARRSEGGEVLWQPAARR